MRSTLGKEGLLRSLTDMGVLPGAILEVHASLRSLGSVDGGAQTVIEALTEAVLPDGAIVMSAYPVSPAQPLSDDDRHRGLAWKVRILSPESTERTGMGVVSDTFRRYPGAMCGSGLHRNCAWGKNAARYCNDYRALTEDGGMCLLMGVGFDRCSSMHVAERSPLPPEIESYWAIPECVRREYDPDRWDIWCGSTPGDPWQKVWQRAESEGLIGHGNIGDAPCHLFKVEPVVRIYSEWRREDPFGLYGVKRLSG